MKGQPGGFCSVFPTTDLTSQPKGSYVDTLQLWNTSFPILFRERVEFGISWVHKPSTASPLNPYYFSPINFIAKRPTLWYFCYQQFWLPEDIYPWASLHAALISPALSSWSLAVVNPLAPSQNIIFCECSDLHNTFISGYPSPWGTRRNCPAGATQTLPILFRKDHHSLQAFVGHSSCKSTHPLEFLQDV
jgi:hypothetical protein